MDDPLDIIVDELGHPTGVAARIGGIEIGDGSARALFAHGIPRVLTVK
jgi:hypothetical protein